MEKKLIALLIIVLLGGLGGGFGLGYTIYKPQVQNLQKTLDDLSREISTINSTLTDTKVSLDTVQKRQEEFNSMLEWEPQPKVITLLINSNVTNLGSWNISVDTSGYKTGFLYCQISQTGKRIMADNWLPLIIRFQADDILGWNVESSEQYLQVYPPGPYTYTSAFKEINIASAKMWLSTSPSFEWAVLSISLYLRD